MPLRKDETDEEDHRGVEHELQGESAKVVIGKGRKRHSCSLDDRRIADVEGVERDPSMRGFWGQAIERLPRVLDVRTASKSGKIDLPHAAFAKTGRHRMVDID